MALPTQRTEFVGRLSTGGLQPDGVVTVTSTAQTLADLNITLSKVTHKVLVQNVGAINIAFGASDVTITTGFLLLPNVFLLFDRLLEGDILDQLYWRSASDVKMAVMQMG